MGYVRFPRLTREGWYFLFVLLFVIGGAVARQLNLLVLLAGMMIGPLVLHGRWVARTLRHLHVYRRMPRRAHAGEPFHVRLGVRNSSRHSGAWLLHLQEHITQVAGPPTDQPTTTVPVAVPSVQPQNETWVSYRAFVPQRGQYQFGPVTVMTRFPLGLLESARTYPVYDTLLVLPRLGRMTDAWRQLVLGNPLGVHATDNRHGLTEADYYGLREWRPGDSVRWIHWRTTARLATLAVRQFERQRNFSVALLVDLWLPERPTVEHQRRLELAVSCAATALMDLARCGGGWMAVAVAGRNVCCRVGQSTMYFLEEIVDRLALEPGGEGHLPDALLRLLQQRPRGAAGVVISTRPDVRNKLERYGQLTPEQLSALRSMAWLDVGSPQIHRYFQWHSSPDAVEEAISSDAADIPSYTTHSTASKSIPL